MKPVMLIRLRGFTLVEVLLGVLIFSVIALSLYSSFNAGLKLNKTLDSSMKAQKDALWALQHIARDMEHMVAYDFSNSYPQQKSLTVDQGSALFFISTGQGIRAVRYFLWAPDEGRVSTTALGVTTTQNIQTQNIKTTEDRQWVVAREEQDFKEYFLNGFDPDDREIMSSSAGAEGLKFLFAQGGPGEEEILWADHWSKDTLPRGVRVELTVQTGSGLVKFHRDVLIPSGDLDAK